MAHTKALGSTKLGRDSIAKRLGVKLHDGERAAIGQIIIRQRGTKYLPGKNVKRGADDTLYASTAGVVRFFEKAKILFDGSRRRATLVNVVPPGAGR
ncbi:50S ribosomal protein L27 [Candidatus Parcubacteria bacterium]|nr:MAG: 50S ribosomal protein L27 [Candidatus Parcubacteria bacterium]